MVPEEKSKCSFKRVRADVCSVVQNLLGDLLNVGIVVLRRVWNRLRRELQNKPLSQHFLSVWIMSLVNSGFRTV